MREQDFEFLRHCRVVAGVPEPRQSSNSERDRKNAERIHSNMSKAVEESRLAEHHQQRAAGIASQLKRSVFSDDSNAIEALEARIATREAEVARQKANSLRVSQLALAAGASACEEELSSDTQGGIT